MTTVYCVFTFQDVLIKIFFDAKIAEKFKQVHVKRGYIRLYTVENDFMGEIKENNKW